MSQDAPVASLVTDVWIETSTHITLHDSICDQDSGIEFLCCPKQITQSPQQYLSETPAHSYTKMRVLKRTKVYEEAEVNKKMKIQEVSFTAQVQQLQSTKKQFEHLLPLRLIFYVINSKTGKTFWKISNNKTIFSSSSPF